MPTEPIQTSRAIGQNPDRTWAKLEARSVSKGFRITEEIAAKLASEPYKLNSSLLVRMLLKMYFDDKIPAAKFQFMKLLQETKE